MLPLLKFPPIFGGDYGSPITWLVLALIIALVIGVGYAVVRLSGMNEE